MVSSAYAVPLTGLPPQTARTVDRAVFKTAYAVIPKRNMSDIVTSRLPHWENTRAWILARPMSGFAETFAEYPVEVAPGGGSDDPEPEPGAEAVLFVLKELLVLTLDGASHQLSPGSYVHVGPESKWKLHNRSDQPTNFQARPRPRILDVGSSEHGLDGSDGKKVHSI